MKHHSRIIDSDDEGFLLEEALIRKNKDFLIIAPHGEQIEMATAAQAEYIASKLEASYWVVKGFAKDNNGFRKWHTPSTKVSEDRFKLLNKLQKEYKTVISLHGLGSQEKIILGGLNSDEFRKKLSEKFKDNLNAPIELANDGSDYAGSSDKNIANRLANQSIQIEQGPVLRRTQGDLIAELLIEQANKL